MITLTKKVWINSLFSLARHREHHCRSINVKPDMTKKEIKYLRGYYGELSDKNPLPKAWRLVVHHLQKGILGHEGYLDEQNGRTKLEGLTQLSDFWELATHMTAGVNTVGLSTTLKAFLLHTYTMNESLSLIKLPVIFLVSFRTNSFVLYSTLCTPYIYPSCWD